MSSIVDNTEKRTEQGVTGYSNCSVTPKCNITEECNVTLKCNNTENCNVTKVATPYTGVTQNITFDDVSSSIQQLEAKGSKVSTKSVREFLSRGSYSTISKFIASYYQQKHRTEENLRLSNLNEDDCLRLAKQIVVLAATGNMQSCIQKLNEEKTQYELLRASLARTIEDLCDNNDSLSKENKRLNDELTKSQNSLNLLKDKLSENAVEVNKLRHELKLHENTITDICKRNEEKTAQYIRQIEELKKLIQKPK